MTETAPGRVTPGQAAYEHRIAAEKHRFPTRTYIAWDRLSPAERADEEAGAQAAIKAAPVDLTDLGAWANLVHELADARALAAEILSHLDDAGVTVDDEIRGAWRERAGLEG